MGQTPELQALQLRIDTKIDELRRKIKRLEALEVEVTLDNLLETNGRKINCTVGEYLKQTIERLETLCLLYTSLLFVLLILMIKITITAKTINTT